MHNFNTKQLFFRTLVIGAGLLCAVGVAAWTGPSATPPGGNVASYWTLSGSNLTTTNNVGIGTASPASALDVVGTINSTKASHVSVMLSYCARYSQGGLCPGSLGAGSWYPAAANLDHTVNVNNDTSTFTTGSNGLVTIKKTGTYLITIHQLVVLSAPPGYGDAACPTINGTVTCFGNGYDEYMYNYNTGGWIGGDHQFIADITAGTVVGYDLLTYQATQYWGWDGYTGMDIVKLN